MAISSFVGSFSTGTGVVTTTIAITGVGFQPKAIMFWWAGRADTSDAIGRATMRRGFGVAVSTSDRRCTAGLIVDAAATSTTKGGDSNDCCIATISAAGAIDGKVDLNSMDVDGFTMIIDDQMPVDVRVSFLAVGGDSLTNAKSGSHTIPTSTGNADTTGVGFQPDFMISFGQIRTSYPSVSGYDVFCIGAAVSSTQQGTISTASTDGQGTATSWSYCTDDEALAASSAVDTSVSAREDFVSFLADGFRLNWVEAGLGSTRHQGYLALKGGNYLVGNLLTQTDTVTDIAETGFGFKPSSALFFSAGRAKSTADTASVNAQMSIGAFSSLTNRGAQAGLDEHNKADSETTTAIEFDEVYANIATDSTIAGLMDVKSVDADGFTMIMDDADPAQAFVWYVAFGPAAVSSSAALLPANMKGNFRNPSGRFVN